MIYVRDFIEVEWEDEANAKENQDFVIPIDETIHGATLGCLSPPSKDESEYPVTFWFAIGTTIIAIIAILLVMIIYIRIRC